MRTGASFIGFGTHRHRVVFYPISKPDPETGLAVINWIAEITVDPSKGLDADDWSKRVELEAFAHHFADWNHEWLDVPAMLRGAKEIYEYPMIDRDPLPTWVDGNAALLGDAAHVMYPTGSNGASQAIVDARVLGAAMLSTASAPRRFEPTTSGCANPFHEWSYAIEARVPSACSTCSTSAAAACSTTSTTSSPRKSENGS